MRITVECDYALRIVLYLATLDSDKKADAATIAEQQKIPQRFSAKILRKLTHAGIIQSYKGVKGGYALLKKPKNITMLDIVRIIDGEIEVNRCLNSDSECNRTEKLKCPVHRELSQINDMICSRLDHINFEYLLQNL